FRTSVKSKWSRKTNGFTSSPTSPGLISRVIGPPAWPLVRKTIRRSGDVKTCRCAFNMCILLSGCFNGRALDGLHLELDVDAVADEKASRFEHLVPSQAKVLAIDRSLCGEAAAHIAPRIRALSAVLGVERNLAGDVTDGEVAD